MSSQIEKILQNIKNKHKAALVLVCQREVDAIKESIDSPYPPASSKGEPPHKRKTGTLQSNVKAESVEDHGNSFSVTIVSDAPYSSYLDTGYLDRPFFSARLRELKYGLDKKIAGELK